MPEARLNGLSKEFAKAVHDRLRREFPQSEIRVFEDHEGAMKVSVEGVKVFDWARIQEYLAELPVPKKQS
jgi:hypothetical protein